MGFWDFFWPSRKKNKKDEIPQENSKVQKEKVEQGAKSEESAQPVENTTSKKSESLEKCDISHDNVAEEQDNTAPPEEEVSEEEKADTDDTEEPEEEVSDDEEGDTDDTEEPEEEVSEEEGDTDDTEEAEEEVSEEEADADDTGEPEEEVSEEEDGDADETGEPEEEVSEEEDGDADETGEPEKEVSEEEDGDADETKEKTSQENSYTTEKTSELEETGKTDVIQETTEEVTPPPKKKSISFWGRLKRLFVGRPKLSKEDLDHVEEILIEADLGMSITEEIMDNLQDKVDGDCSFADIVEVLKEEITNRLQDVHTLSNSPLGNPHVILVVGVNGVGKTTTIGKLAHYYAREGKKVILGAADTFRAAAPEQLTTWAKRSGSTIVNLGMQRDPSGVAYETIQKAQKEKADIVIIDTAGRLQNKIPLMNQLGKIKRVMQKLMPDAPHEVLLVLDGTTGQNGWQQAMAFKEAVGVTGLIVTKLDSLAKGGIIVGLTGELGIPVKYLGFGENIEDLRAFDAKEFADRFFEKKE